MASVTADVFAFMVLTVWTFLTLVPDKVKHPAYNMVLTSQDVLESIMSSCLVEFAPGLLDVLQSDTPPGLTFFKSLSTNYKKRWAVYVVVFEKSGRPFKIYVGSATAKKGGVRRRMSNYDYETVISDSVKGALKDGYKITHKGLLCWAPIPTASKVYKLRVVFLALEAACSVILWAMKNPTKNYGMPNMCPWPKDSLFHNGLCTHSSLIEGIDGEPNGLTDEEIEAKGAELEKRYKDWRNAYKARVRAMAKNTSRYRCKLCDVPFFDSTALNAHKLTKKHLDNVQGTGKVVKDPVGKARKNQNREEKRFHCDICDVSALSQGNLNAHYRTEKHKNNAEAAGVSAAQPTPSSVRINAANKYCTVCRKWYSRGANLRKHLRTDGHRLKAAALGKEYDLTFS